MADGYVIAIAILAFLMAFSIGANDAANALATSYGSNALGLLWLVLLGSLFEFIGAFWCSGHVAGKLVENVIESVNVLDDQLVEQIMLGASISSFIFIMMSSVFGMPISGTHTVVGALIGSGLATVGSSDINWEKLGMIVASWFVAPVLSIFLCTIIFIVVCKYTIDAERYSYKARMLCLTFITGMAFFLIAVMFIKLIQEKDTDMSGGAIAFLVISPVLGIFITRTILLLLVKTRSLSWCDGIIIVLKFWTCSDLVNLDNQRQAGAPLDDANAAQEQLVVGAPSVEHDVLKEVYRYLMLLAAMMVCMGHGSNDVANSISPLITVV